jgi:hypothetical protein
MGSSEWAYVECPFPGGGNSSDVATDFRIASIVGQREETPQSINVFLVTARGPGFVGVRTRPQPGGPGPAWWLLSGPGSSA